MMHIADETWVFLALLCCFAALGLRTAVPDVDPWRRPLLVGMAFCSALAGCTFLVLAYL